jgi:serine/threonine protein kinase
MRRGGLVTEARLMQRLSTHPNLVQFYRWSADDDGNEYVVMELVAMGSLDKILAQVGVGWG